MCLYLDLCCSAAKYIPFRRLCFPQNNFMLERRPKRRERSPCQETHRTYLNSRQRNQKFGTNFIDLGSSSIDIIIFLINYYQYK